MSIFWFICGVLFGVGFATLWQAWEWEGVLHSQKERGDYWYNMYKSSIEEFNKDFDEYYD